MAPPARRRRRPSSRPPGAARGRGRADRARAARPVGPTVGAIEVEGNRRVEVDAIKGAMVTKVGMPVDAKSIQQDVRSVMKLGYFADVSIEEKGRAGAVPSWW